jgi:hypothetical protein
MAAGTVSEVPSRCLLASGGDLEAGFGDGLLDGGALDQRRVEFHGDDKRTDLVSVGDKVPRRAELISTNRSTRRYCGVKFEFAVN